jgi:hypothetical protein
LKLLLSRGSGLQHENGPRTNLKLTRNPCSTGENFGDPGRSTTQRNCKWLDRQTCLSKFTEPKALFPTLANRSDESFIAEYRDRPLTFQWQSPLGLVDALSLPAARNGAHAATRGVVVAEALLGAASGQGVSYSRRKASYSMGKRYRGPLHTYATVLRSVEELEEAGWLRGHRVKPNHRSWQSSFWATPELIQASREFDADLIYEAREPIRLKDEADELVDYAETRETLRIRRALEPINAHLKDLKIELPGAVRQGRHLGIGDSQILPLPGNGLQRIFSRGSFDYHGRAYGWWQNIPKTSRGDLTLDGEVTAEADYTALHASILYGERGIKFQSDPYDIETFSRDHIKLGFNIAVNARNKRSAVCALADDAGISRCDAANLLDAIEKRHKPIGDAFCSDAGVRLMRIDSELILRALRAMNDDGFGALPIHDALVAPARFIGLAAEKMVEAFETLVGCVSPCQIKIKTAKVPHMGERSGFPSADPSAVGVV